MPYIRFSRDRRGYEHTYVLHAARRNGKKHAHLLYWFRTPPNVKVGRAPLDEDAIRAIEENNPQLTFDWTRMLEARPAPAPEPAHARRRRVREKGPPVGKARGTAGRRRQARPAETVEDVEVEPEAPPVGPVDAPASLEPAVEPADLNEGRPPVESTSPLPESARPVPAEEIVGAEGLARLRTRYAEVQARITDRGGDPGRVEQLRREAERLNPDAWVTLDEARRGLEQFEAAFDALRRALGRRRRSRRGGARRSRRRRALAEAEAQQSGGETAPDEAAAQHPQPDGSDAVGAAPGSDEDGSGAGPDEFD